MGNSFEHSVGTSVGVAFLLGGGFRLDIYQSYYRIACLQ
jgi:hypothetical protein